MPRRNARFVKPGGRSSKAAAAKITSATELDGSDQPFAALNSSHDTNSELSGFAYDYNHRHGHQHPMVVIELPRTSSYKKVIVLSNATDEEGQTNNRDLSISYHTISSAVSDDAKSDHPDTLQGESDICTPEWPGTPRSDFYELQDHDQHELDHHQQQQQQDELPSSEHHQQSHANTTDDPSPLLPAGSPHPKQGEIGQHHDEAHDSNHTTHPPSSRSPTPSPSPPKQQPLLFNQEDLAIDHLLEELKNLLDAKEDGSDSEDESETYEQRRQRKLRDNQALLAQLGLASVEDASASEGQSAPTATTNLAQHEQSLANDSDGEVATISGSVQKVSKSSRSRYQRRIKFAQDGTTTAVPPKGERYGMAYIDPPPLRERAMNEYIFIPRVPEYEPEFDESWSESEEEAEQDENGAAEEQAQPDTFKQEGDELETPVQKKKGRPRKNPENGADIKPKKPRAPKEPKPPKLPKTPKTPKPPKVPKPKVPRDLSTKGMDIEGGASCHQCRRKTQELKMRCNQKSDDFACNLLFCSRCMRLRYGMYDYDPQSTTFICPRCNGICNCSICLRKGGLESIYDSDPTRKRVMNLSRMCVDADGQRRYSSVHELLQAAHDSGKLPERATRLTPRSANSANSPQVAEKRGRKRKSLLPTQNGDEAQPPIKKQRRSAPTAIKVTNSDAFVSDHPLSAGSITRITHTRKFVIKLGRKFQNEQEGTDVEKGEWVDPTIPAVASRYPSQNKQVQLASGILPSSEAKAIRSEKEKNVWVKGATDYDRSDSSDLSELSSEEEEESSMEMSSSLTFEQQQYFYQQQQQQQQQLQSQEEMHMPPSYPTMLPPPAMLTSKLFSEDSCFNPSGALTMDDDVDEREENEDREEEEEEEVGAVTVIDGNLHDDNVQDSNLDTNDSINSLVINNQNSNTHENLVVPVGMVFSTSSDYIHPQNPSQYTNTNVSIPNPTPTLAEQPIVSTSFQPLLLSSFPLQHHHQQLDQFSNPLLVPSNTSPSHSLPPPLPPTLSLHFDPSCDHQLELIALRVLQTQGML